ncbi:hypothetical protein M3Y99_00357400 [Aphelenchoides fujianensis]|nr:hypothetical protein M3Y99_00357400 [Aphelenchoides fujianensis]
MVKETKYYEILEVSPTASENELKEGEFCLELVRIANWPFGYNPNEGERFKLISQAYEVLSDPKKRQIYDQHGEEGIKEGGGGGMHNPMDIFDMFFGGGGGFRQQQQTKVRDMVHQLSVPLEKFYSGHSKTLRVSRQVLCSKCDGIGGAKDSVSKCANCRGQGMEFHRIEIAPGLVQQTQRPCSKCSGTGEIIKDVCKQCNGRKKVKSEETIEVHIEKGMPDGEKIVFHGKGDQEVGLEPGNIVIVLDEQEHEVFMRRGTDLHMEMTLNITEALCGCHKPLKTLDGRVIVFSLLPGEVIKHEDKRVIHGEGMPTYRHPELKGDLVIHFKVEFPAETPKRNLKQLHALLPGKNEIIVADDAVEYETTDVTAEMVRNAQERESHGPRIQQCAPH